MINVLIFLGGSALTFLVWILICFIFLLFVESIEKFKKWVLDFTVLALLVWGGLLALMIF